jgi:hypothetical protein
MEQVKMYQWIQKKLSDWSFNKARKKYAEGRYYQVGPDKNGLHPDDMDRIEQGLPFLIVKGPFAGIAFSFLRVAIQEETVTFSVHVLNRNKQEVKKNPKFQAVTREILLGVLYKLYSGDEHLGFGLKPGEEFSDENRDDHFEESDPKRAIRSKGSSVLEDGPV